MYYSEIKKKAYADVKSLATNNTSYDDIVFYIMEKYGLSERIIKPYYEKLKDRGFINENNNQKKSSDTQ